MIRTLFLIHSPLIPNPLKESGWNTVIRVRPEFIVVAQTDPSTPGSVTTHHWKLWIPAFYLVCIKTRQNDKISITFYLYYLIVIIGELVKTVKTKNTLV